ncbi:uncharacterized protein LOC143460398 [Clavelina lepadiformis]|uniref:RING-type domain-containing protein n=1 Tax=Clavelina lepadiformis TaxID=159417 RepID=A0ABP0FPN7_CLALP
MEDWLHCNHCFVPFHNKPKGCAFYLTNCAHVFCSNCEKEATSPVCEVCKQKCCTTQLNEKLDASVAMFFKPSANLHKKALEVENFQSKQRKMFFKALAQKDEHHAKLLRGAMETVEHLKKENAELKRIIVKNRANISISPKSPRHPSPTADRSPRSSPSHSPQRISPSKSHKTPPTHIPRTSHTQFPSHNPLHPTDRKPPPCYSSAPCTPNQIGVIGGHQHLMNTAEKKRVSLRSPPVDGKIYSPTNKSPSKPQAFKSQGIISQPAIKRSYPGSLSSYPSAPSPASTSVLQKRNYNFPQPSPKPFGTTPPSTPKFPRSISASCPITPENKLHAYYAMLEKRRR